MFPRKKKKEVKNVGTGVIVLHHACPRSLYSTEKNERAWEIAYLVDYTLLLCVRTHIGTPRTTHHIMHDTKSGTS